jgi:hypothetical protein
MKIGVTEAKEFRLRLNNLQSGYPGKLYCYGEYPCAVPWQVEMKAHALLIRQKIYGEWFKVTEKEAAEAIIFAMETPLTVDQIGERVGLSVKSLYKYLGRREVAQYAAVRRAKRKGKTT